LSIDKESRQAIAGEGAGKIGRESIRLMTKVFIAAAPFDFAAYAATLRTSGTAAE